MTRRVDGAAPAGLACRGLRVDLGGRLVLDGADLDVASGGAVAVMGPSGSGKTTLLHCLAGLRVPDDGEVVVVGEVVSAMGAGRRARFRLGRVGMVFQFGELLEELTVAENVALPLRLRGEPGRERVAAVLAAVGLGDRAGSMPGELSGGEVQRAAIARAVAGRPRLLLADEPTGALDEDLSQAVAELLVATARAVDAVLVVATHDPIVAGVIGSTVRLRRGKLEPA